MTSSNQFLWEDYEFSNFRISNTNIGNFKLEVCTKNNLFRWSLMVYSNDLNEIFHLDSGVEPSLKEAKNKVEQIYSKFIFDHLNWFLTNQKTV